MKTYFYLYFKYFWDKVFILVLKTLTVKKRFLHYWPLASKPSDKIRLDNNTHRRWAPWPHLCHDFLIWLGVVEACQDRIASLYWPLRFRNVTYSVLTNWNSQTQHVTVRIINITVTIGITRLHFRKYYDCRYNCNHDHTNAVNTAIGVCKLVILLGLSADYDTITEQSLFDVSHNLIAIREGHIHSCTHILLFFSQSWLIHTPEEILRLDEQLMHRSIFL